MSDTIGTYSFLPWLRQGLANQIESADHDALVKLRAAVTVALEVKGSGGGAGDVTKTVSKKIGLYGPGDVIGIERRAIIKSEPRDWITNFEPNYFPYVDFYDEDFPWRYTPAAPAGHRLRPWIALIVLEEGEFKDGGSVQGRPLPYVVIDQVDSAFPPADELWAWAHVHVNRNIAGDQADRHAPSKESVIAGLESLLAVDPDLAYARLLCPRKLKPNVGYHAFLMPTFDTGRLAGLGIDPGGAAHATASAWGDGRTAPTDFPYYHRWTFRTGARGDFEYLVRLLKPAVADAGVGRRDIDVQDPGSNIHGITDPELTGILKLGGALLAPLSDEAEAALAKYENWATPYPQPFQSELAAFVNLADDYRSKAAAAAHQATTLDPAIRDDPDPLITPPLYGRWHALTPRLLTAVDGSAVSFSDNWVHELNLDPRWRSAAGFGTEVVQQNQEQYMEAAWRQIGDVLEGNRRIRWGQFALRTMASLHTKHLTAMVADRPAKALLLMTPVQRRVLSGDTTVFHQVRQSPLTPAVTSAALRRMTRPRGRLEKRLGFTAAQPAERLAERVNAGEVTAAPPVKLSDSVPTLDDIADAVTPKDAPAILIDLLKRFPWLPWAVLLLLLLVVLVLLMAVGFSWVGGGLAVAVVGAGVAAYLYLARLKRRLDGAEALRGDNQTPESVDALPGSADFSLTTEIDPRGLTAASPPGAVTLGGSDNETARRFKSALKDAHVLLQAARAAGRPKPVIPLTFAAIIADTLKGLDPAVTVPRRTWAAVTIPPHIRDLIGESFVEAMTYPELDTPMYEPLVKRSTELFVPNLHLIPQNSITLLQTNQRFIEAYMVGLNHEFARELLWREYPTDQRGSYFRQFWDVRSFLDGTGDSAAEQKARREKLKDIPELHRWPRASKLGEHDHREAGRENEEELVLVIRGELLKKYPTAVIYARRARWQMKSDGVTPDKAKERVFDETVPVKTPLYEAKVDPDIYFFGFDLTETEARGDDTVNDKPGWFFVIEERPGEVRFGFDLERDPADKIWVWNDLTWGDVAPGIADGDFLKLATTPVVALQTGSLPTTEVEKTVQRDEDRHIPQWHGNLGAAELAYILYQAPVQMGVHASEMLPET
jgi:hypothetical protein